jgi:hypothetical protein
MEYNISAIKPYLRLEDPRGIRTMMWVWLMMLNIFGFLIVLYVNFTILKRNLGSMDILTFLIFTILLDIWGLIIIINPWKMQKQYVLFTGVFAVELSIMHLVLFAQTIYDYLKQAAIPYIILAIVGYLITGALWFIYAINGLRTQKIYSASKKQSLYINIGTMSAFLGLILGRVLINVTKGKSASLSFIIASLLIAYVCIFLSLYIHKYFLIKKYEILVK